MRYVESMLHLRVDLLLLPVCRLDFPHQDRQRILKHRRQNAEQGAPTGMAAMKVVGKQILDDFKRRHADPHSRSRLLRDLNPFAVYIGKKKKIASLKPYHMPRHKGKVESGVGPQFGNSGRSRIPVLSARKLTLGLKSIIVCKPSRANSDGRK